MSSIPLRKQLFFLMLTGNKIIDIFVIKVHVENIVLFQKQN